MMRAKLTVAEIKRTDHAETLKFNAVYSDNKEDNSYSAATPSASVEFQITNKGLWGKFNPGDKFYVVFTKIPATA